MTVTSRLEYALGDIFGYLREFLQKHFQTDLDVIVVVKAGDHVVMRDSFPDLNLSILILKELLKTLEEKQKRGNV